MKFPTETSRFQLLIEKLRAHSMPFHEVPQVVNPDSVLATHGSLRGKTVRLNPIQDGVGRHEAVVRGLTGRQCVGIPMHIAVTGIVNCRSAIRPFVVFLEYGCWGVLGVFGVFSSFVAYAVPRGGEATESLLRIGENYT